MSKPKNVPEYFAMLDKLAVGTKKEIEDRAQFENATRYKGQVFSNVMTQRYASAFAPLDPDYVKSKTKAGGNAGFWRMYDSLISNLKAFKFGRGKGKGWVGGVYPGSTSPQGKDITKYGLAVENDIKGGRPLFGMTMDEYANKDWKMVGKTSLKKIRALWR